MGMWRRSAPWAASAAIHALLGAVAFLTVAHMAGDGAPRAPDASYTVAIRPGGGPTIGETPRIGDRSYGVPLDNVTVTLDDELKGIPELKLQSEPNRTLKVGTGEPATGFSRGTNTRFPVQGGGGSSSNPGPGTGSGIGEGRDEGVEAVPLETPSPAYPDAARRGNVQGIVIAELRIDAQGRVEFARAAEGSGSRILDDAALAAVKAWRYQPATLGGKPVPSVRRVRFVFRLES